MSLSIGIESCGKSFTVITAANEDGEILAAERQPLRLNYHENDKQRLAADIFRLVKRILAKCGYSTTDFIREQGSICAGITGITTKHDREKGMLEVWEDAGLADLSSKIATGGVEIEFTGATRSLRGGAIVSHVGSVAMARTEQSIARIGGWGALFGDEGSGYWMGIKAINTISRLRDERLDRSRTEIGRFVLARLSEYQIWEDLLEEHRQLYAEKPADSFETEFLWADALISLSIAAVRRNEFRYIISDLAKAVFDAWEDDKSDEIANSIVEDAASELLNQGLTALKRCHLEEEDIPLVLWGGVFRYNPAFTEKFAAQLQSRCPNAKIVLPDAESAMRPVIGALAFALSRDMFALPAPQVLENLESSAINYPELSND